MSGRYRVVALVGIFGISFAGVLVRAIDLHAVTTLFYRALFAIPVLALLWWVQRTQDTRPARSRLMAVAAGAFLGLDLAFWHLSIEYIGVGLATVLVNTQIVFVAVIAWVRYNERPSVVAALATPFVFFGVALVAGLGGGEAYGEDPLLGVVFGVVGGFFYALFLVGMRESNQGYLAPAQGPMLDATVGTAVVGLVLGVLFVDDFGISMTGTQLSWMIVLAMSAQVAGWLLVVAALPRLGALEASLLILMQPVLASIWAMIIFDERFSASQWLGVIIVLGGMLIINVAGAVAPQTETSDQVA